MTETVAAVVVTYNRKELLCECLDALLAQTRPVDKIILIDNASTDGTPDLLIERGYLSNPLLDYVRLPENTGGAGGFHEGVKKGYEQGYDWLWLMDDDTVALPDSLRYLLHSSTLIDKPIGFICSKVKWIDGSVHLMNVPEIISITHGIPFNSMESTGFLFVESCSFVSTIVCRCAIKSSGLPIKEMFIWGDDSEFFSRITSCGFVGLYSSSSAVIHKTNENYSSNLFKDTRANFWKHRYGIRNNLYLVKSKHGTLRYLVNILFRITLYNSLIVKNRKDSTLDAVLVNTWATLSSLFFHPKIDLV